jgi:thymidine phosphorylase
LDLGAGIEIAAKVGEWVEAGDALFHVDHNVDGPLPDVSGAFVIDGSVQAQAPASRLLETVNINDIVVS